jgi:hypothetical protein
MYVRDMVIASGKIRAGESIHHTRDSRRTPSRCTQIEDAEAPAPAVDPTRLIAHLIAPRWQNARPSRQAVVRLQENQIDVLIEAAVRMAHYPVNYGSCTWSGHYLLIS